MDYEPPTLCIRSITEADAPGRFILDMPSLWYDDGPVEVDEHTINYVTGERFTVPTCPTGYPNPPEADPPVSGDAL